MKTELYHEHSDFQKNSFLENKEQLEDVIVSTIFFNFLPSMVKIVVIASDRCEKLLPI